MKNRNEINRISSNRADAGRDKTSERPQNAHSIALASRSFISVPPMLWKMHEVYGKRSFAINSDKTFRRHFRLFVCFIYGEDNREKSLEDLCDAFPAPRILFAPQMMVSRPGAVAARS